MRYIVFYTLDCIQVLMLNNGITKAKAASQLESLIEASDVEHSQITFEKPPSLKVLESLLIAIYEESKDYRIWPLSTASA